MSFKHRFGRSTLTVLLLAAPLLVAPLQGAVRLEYLKKETVVWPGKPAVERVDSEVTVVDGPRAYLKNQRMTTIVDTSKGEVVVVDHMKKVFSVGQLPFHVEDYVDEPYKPTLRANQERLATFAIFDKAGEVVQVGSWQARKVHVVAISPQYSDRVVLDVWLTTDPHLDYETFDVLARVQIEQSFSYSMDSWAEELVALDGVPVRQEFETALAGTSLSRTLKLRSVTEVEVPPEAFRPPVGYREVPLDYSDLLRIKELPPGVSQH